MNLIINQRITQHAWISAFVASAYGTTRVWSTAAFAVEGSIAPGSLADGLVEMMDDDLVVFEFNATRTGPTLNGTIFVVSSQLAIHPGGAPRRAVTIRLRGARCEYRETANGSVPRSCSGGVASTQPMDGSCFQNEPTAESCGLRRMGNLLPLVLPGGSAQLVNYVGDGDFHGHDPSLRQI